MQRQFALYYIFLYFSLFFQGAGHPMMTLVLAVSTRAKVVRAVQAVAGVVGATPCAETSLELSFLQCRPLEVSLTGTTIHNSSQ